MNGTKRMEIDCGEFKLVAEMNFDKNYREIFVGIETDGVWTQDLAIVGQQYHYADDKIVYKNSTSVKIYSDAASEDYTHDFVVDLFKEEERYV